MAEKRGVGRPAKTSWDECADPRCEDPQNGTIPEGAKTPFRGSVERFISFALGYGIRLAATDKFCYRCYRKWRMRQVRAEKKESLRG